MRQIENDGGDAGRGSFPATTGARGGDFRGLTLKLNTLRNAEQFAYEEFAAASRSLVEYKRFKRRESTTTAEAMNRLRVAWETWLNMQGKVQEATRQLLAFVYDGTSPGAMTDAGPPHPR